MITRPVITGAATMVAASALAYGGWTLFGALTRPAPDPLVFAALTPPALVADTPAMDAAPLAAVFGEPSDAPFEPPLEPDLPDMEPDMEPEGQPWSEDFFEDDYLLRGVITGETGAMAILETPDGTQVVREGSVLIGGEEVMTIGPDSVEILIGDEMYSISFSDDMMDPNTEDWNDLELLR